MIQYRKQLLSCSQSSSSSLITEIENIFSSHIVIHFEINPGMCSHYSVHIIHLKFSVSQTFALHYKASCEYQSYVGRDKTSIRCQYLLSSPRPGNTQTYLQAFRGKKVTLPSSPFYHVLKYLLNAREIRSGGARVEFLVHDER